MHGTTMIYVTHDQVEAMTLADRICVLDQGRVEQVGTPMELYDRPGNIFVAGFIGSPKMNFMKGAIAAKHKCDTLGIRPEHLDIDGAKGEVEGTVDFTEVLGSDSFIYANTAYGLITARQPGKTGIVKGEKIFLTPITKQLHRFDTNGKRID